MERVCSYPYQSKYRVALEIKLYLTLSVLTDLPLILILSVYADFLTFKFGKVQIFLLKLSKIQIFGGLPKVFPYTFLIHTDIFPKILIFQFIYTDFVSGHSGRSVFMVPGKC